MSARDELTTLILGKTAPCAADAILAAGYVKSDTVIHVHHHDIENHARSFNEGYETAMAQELADNPTTAQDWLEEKLQEARAQALEEAAALVASEEQHQWHRSSQRLPGAQIVAQRMQVLVRVLRKRAADERHAHASGLEESMADSSETPRSSNSVPCDPVPGWGELRVPTAFQGDDK